VPELKTACPIDTKSWIGIHNDSDEIGDRRTRREEFEQKVAKEAKGCLFFAQEPVGFEVEPSGNLLIELLAFVWQDSEAYGAALLLIRNHSQDVGYKNKDQPFASFAAFCSNLFYSFC
jgi:hypothetical protein